LPGVMTLFPGLVVRNGPNHQFSFVHSFQPAKPGRDFAKLPGWSPQQDDLQTQIVGQVRMDHRNDEIMVIVLEFHKLVAELTAMMIIHQRQSPRDIVCIFDPCTPRQRVVDELANRFASGGKTLFATISLKPLQQVPFQRDRKANNL